MKPNHRPSVLVKLILKTFYSTPVGRECALLVVMGGSGFMPGCHPPVLVCVKLCVYVVHKTCLSSQPSFGTMVADWKVQYLHHFQEPASRRTCWSRQRGASLLLGLVGVWLLVVLYASLSAVFMSSLVTFVSKQKQPEACCCQKANSHVSRACCLFTSSVSHSLQAAKLYSSPTTWLT